MFGQKPKKELKAISLSREPDLSGDNNVGAAFSETTSCVYFLVHDSDDLGKLTFKAKSYRAVLTDCNPYMNKTFSFLLEVAGSEWPMEMDKWVYLDSRNASWFLESKKRVKHYVVAGNDIYHEFLADGFSEEYLVKGCEEYQVAIQILGIQP
jgi:hypothetical protein